MSRRGRNAERRSNGDGWEEWGGYMNAKRHKLKEQFDQEAPTQLKKEGSGSKIFSGISIYVNGYTKPSSDELKRLMMLHGGNYEHYLYRTRVTHVIATNLPNSKVKELKGLKVVRPEWITDSIAAGKLVSYTKYLLYTAQSGGIQKGLQSYTTTQQDYNHSIVGTQSRQVDTQSTRLFNSESDNTENQSCSKDKFDNVELDLDDGDLVKINQSHVNNSNLVVNERKVHGDTIYDVPSASRAVSSHVSPATAGDPKFLNEFYSNSRLHFLSTWKAEWKSYVNELQNKGDNFPDRERLRKIVIERELTPDELVENSSKRRCVMLVDMDCFFVSVGLRKRPDLKGKPVAVTHSRGKGYKPDPKSDLNFERQQWELKRLQGGKKGRRKTGQVLMPEIKEGDTSFPDISDSDDSDTDDVINDVSDVVKESTESFHSMAEIASCSYEARKTGVRNGMFMGRAKGICPELVTIPYDFNGYKEVSRILYDTVASYTHDIEAVSCDEMLIDCTDLLRNTGATPLEFSSLLRSEIFEKTGCTASAGIGSSILLARMATRKAKPNGQFHLTESLVVDYIRSQPVKDLPGVGWSLTKRFEALKVITCGDLQRISLESLQKEFGPKTGQSLYRYCRGLDDRLVKMEQQRKSVSAEVNYGIRFTLDSEAVKFMEELSSEVCSRLKSIKMKGKSITLKLMVRRKDAPKETSKFMGHGICNNFSKSVTLPMSTDEPRIVAKETVGLLRQHKVEPGDLRGIGIQMQKLEPAEVGTVGINKRLPSILNYTVNTKSMLSESKHDNPKSDNCVQDSGVLNNINDRGKPGTIKCDDSMEPRPETSIGDFVRTKHLQGTSVTEVSGTETIDSTGNVGTNNKLKQNMPTFSNGPNDMEVYDDVIETPARSLDVEPVDQDLVEDLGRRFEAQSQLPPLPSFPDIRTPESAKKVVLSKTPDIPTQEVDYFPSPSQVDPEVLRELPVEIREQIEKEIGNRRKRKMESKVSADVVKSASHAGCSTWQPDRGENSPDNGNQNKGGNKSEGTIVALPSPSQIDPSCMDALPESLQAEIRQAYAKQDSNRRVNVKGGNTLQLKQAKSPVKSPGKNRRSPGKNSPNFKVPRGRPSGRGRKKSSSKKTLFKDQSGSIPQNTTDSNLSTGTKTLKHSALPSTSDAVTHRSDDFIDLCPDSDENMHHCSAIDKEIECDNLASDTTKYKQHSVSSDGSDRKNCDDENCVSLCGAVTLKEVKLLVKEWIASTPVPQQEDEEVLMKYLQTLVIVKNLELVDLILKFILRNIHTVNSAEWMYSLQRVYSYIQTVVYQIYGSRLASITL